MFRLVSLFFLFTLFLVPTSSFAQFSTEIEPIDVSLTPSYPKPYEVVTITPGSSVVDLFGSSVTISANGKVLQKGTGTQSAAVQVGGAGETTTVTVAVVGPDGQKYTKQVTIRPGGVSLIVEPVSTSHPFYKGLSLVAPEARIRLIALPDLRTSSKSPIDPATLIYTWKLGDRILEDSSGIGRSVLVVTAPIRYRDADILLTVTSPDQSQVAEERITISPATPVVRIYASDPLLGTNYDRALTGTFSLPSTEATFRAVAYFFGGDPSYTWSVGGTPQGATKDITVRSTGSGAGSAALEVRTKSQNNADAASSRMTLRFGAGKSSSGLFGF